MASQLVPAKAYFPDQNGRPLAGGKVYFYQVGTEIKRDTFQDSALTIPNTNPIILDSYGEALIWGTGRYRQVLTDKNDVLVWDQVVQDANASLIGNMTDAVYVPGDGTGNTFIPGTTTALTLPSAPGSISNMWLFFDGTFQTDDQISSLNQTALTLTSPIPNGVNEVTVKIGTTVAIGTPGAGTVTDSSVSTAAAINASKLLFLQAGANAVRRTVLSKLQDIVNVMDFGAKGDGATDDTAAIQAAIIAAGNGTLDLPAKNFLFSQLTISAGLTIRGSGKYGGTVLNCSTVSGDSIICSGTQPVEFHDILFQNSATKTGGSAINFTGISAGHLIRRCSFPIAFNGLNFQNNSIWSVEDCDFVSHTGTAIQVANSSNVDEGDSTITGCVFDAPSPTANHIVQFSSGGLRVSNNKFLGGAYHYLGEFNGTSSTSILLFENNSSEYATSANFAVTSQNASAGFARVIVSGNEFAIAPNATGLLFPDPGFTFLDNVVVGGNTFETNGGAVTTSMNFGRMTNLLLLPNSIIGGQVGVIFGPNMGNATVHPQHMVALSIFWEGTFTNATFSPGRRESGQSAASITVAQGPLFIGPPVSVTYTQPYAVAPIPKLTPIIGNNVVSAVVTSFSTTGFTWQAIGTQNTVTAQCGWEAHG